MEIYLIRHTQPDIAQGVCYGRADLTLAESFEEELQKLLPKIPSTFDRLVSSPAKRCTLLAQRIAKGAIEEDDRLWEMNFGEWELKRWGDIPRQQSNLWMKDFVRQRPPLGENFLEVQQRVVHFWEELKTQNLEKVALIFHGGPIRALLSHLLGIPLKNVFQLQIDYGRVCLLEMNDSFVKLKRMNF